MNFDRKLKTEYKMHITELKIKIVLNLKIEQHFKKWLITWKTIPHLLTSKTAYI